MLLKYQIEALILIGCLLDVIAHSGQPIGISSDTAFKFQATSYLFYFYAFWRINKIGIQDAQRFGATIGFVGTLYVSNAIDEFFLDPTLISWNEYVGAVLACLVSYAEYKGWIKVIKEWLICKAKLTKVKLKEKYNAVISWWHRSRYILWRKK